METPQNLDSLGQRSLRVFIAHDRSAAALDAGRCLRSAGMHVTSVAAGSQTADEIRAQGPDVVLICLGERGLDRFGIVEDLRGASDRPGIVFLVGGPIGADSAAELGRADDYVRPDLDPGELALRVEVVAARRAASGRGALLRAGPVRIDRDARRVLVAGRQVKLTATEFEILLLLVRNAGRVVTKAAILDHVWHHGFHGESNIVESYVYGLRRKLIGVDRSVIRTVRGIGYLFAVDEEDHVC